MSLCIGIMCCFVIVRVHNAVPMLMCDLFESICVLLSRLCKLKWETEGIQKTSTVLSKFVRAKRFHLIFMNCPIFKKTHHTFTECKINGYYSDFKTISKCNILIHKINNMFITNT